MKIWRMIQNLLAMPNAPGTCPGCGHPNDVWQDTGIKDGYVITRLWRGCPNYRIALGLHDWTEMNRHYVRWTEVSRNPLVGTGIPAEPKVYDNVTATVKKSSE